MFTGIIERLGHVAALQQVAGGSRLAIELDAELENLVTGESIAVSGVCLTLEADSPRGRPTFYLSGETLKRTTLGNLAVGALVNVERALQVGDRIGGHFVHGHVDAVGVITRWQPDGEGWLLEVKYPPNLVSLIAPKGSIAVDGISLTVVSTGMDRFTVAVIPHTAKHTSLSRARIGTHVNLEADMLARYVLRALGTKDDGGVTREMLGEAGFASQ